VSHELHQNALMCVASFCCLVLCLYTSSAFDSAQDILRNDNNKCHNYNHNRNYEHRNSILAVS
jgi:hypothetical protein